MSDISSDTGGELKSLNVPGFHLWIYSLFLLGLLSRSPVTRSVIFVPILVSSIYVLLYRSLPPEDGSTFPLLFQTVLRASDAFVINNATKLRRVGQRQKTNELAFWDRVKWALDFVFNIRRIGWTDEPRHILPPHPTHSRSQFVRSRIMSGMFYFAVADILQTISWYVPMDAWQESSIKGIALRPLCTILHGLVLWSLLALVHTIIAIIAVAIGITTTSTWPLLYGKWSDAYTVRRFWGRTWHQLFRRFVSEHGDFVAYRLLHLQKDTFIGVNIQRYVAFFLSGIVHAVGEYGLIRSNFWEHHASMRFFILQATVIMVEQVFAKIMGIKAGKWTKRAGYVWTFLWFTLTYLPWLQPQFQFGMDYQVGMWKKGSITKFLCTGAWNFEVI